MLSLRSRVALTTFGVAALCILSLTAAALWLAEPHHERYQSEADLAAFAMLAELARVEAEDGRLQRLASASQRLADSPTIETVLITDARRRVIASNDPSLLATKIHELDGWQVLEVFSPEGQASVVAMRRVPLSWRQTLLPRFAILAVISLMAAAILSILLSLGLTRRLSKLRQAAQQVVNPPDSADDEISAIGHAIDELSRTAAHQSGGLASRDQQIRSLSDELPVGMSYVDKDLRMLFMNRTLEGWLGWKREALLGRHLAEFMSPEHYEETLRGLSPALRGERVQRERDFSIDGTTAVISAVNIPDRDGEGEVRGVFSLLRNVTKRRAHEERTERLLEQLEAKNAELESFSYSVSHDLKGPLTTILGCSDMMELTLRESELAEGGELPKPLAAELREIRHAAVTMRKMLDEVLELARVGLVANQQNRVNLHRLAEDVIRLLSGHIGRYGTQVQLSDALPTVLGDRQRLQRVLLNLIDNAVKFSADVESPMVEIGQRLEDGAKIIYVRDNGRGISPEQQAQVFDLFRKLHPESEGTGIGLSIVERIIQVHGGRIWVESAGEGHGATFCFTLPEADPLTAGPEPRAAGQRSGAYVSIQGSGGFPRLPD